MAEPYVMTDPNGDKLTFDPACKGCGGSGRYVSGYSGREGDGNAPEWDACNCFIPVGVLGTYKDVTEGGQCGRCAGDPEQCPHVIPRGAICPEIAKTAGADLCREPGCNKPSISPIHAWCKEHDRRGGVPYA